MQESYFHVNNQFYYIAHSALQPNLPTLLFLHGLGDSGINYLHFLQSPLSLKFNILIPDLLGHGRSADANDYSFKQQVDGIIKQVEFLQEKYRTQLSDIILVAHSMGGIHATLLCESVLKDQIKALINVEGSITQYGSFASEAVLHAKNENCFPAWFDQFKQGIYQKGESSIGFQQYYASLLFCRSEAFMQNGLEMRELSTALPGKFSSVVGKKYAELTLPRIYCYGDSLAKETLNFLDENQLKKQYLPCPNHFIMTDCFNHFVSFLEEFINTAENADPATSAG